MDCFYLTIAQLSNLAYIKKIIRIALVTRVLEVNKYHTAITV
jgi:hypothetical protein